MAQDEEGSEVKEKTKKRPKKSKPRQTLMEEYEEASEEMPDPAASKAKRAKIVPEKQTTLGGEEVSSPSVKKLKKKKKKNKNKIEAAANENGRSNLVGKSPLAKAKIVAGETKNRKKCKKKKTTVE